MTDSTLRKTLISAYFGNYGGQFVPDALLPVLDELEQAYVDALNDPEFSRELARLQSTTLVVPLLLPNALTSP